MEPIKFKVAVFEYTSIGMKGYRFAASLDSQSPDQIRVSEWVDVEFTPVGKSEDMVNFVKAIDNEIKGIQSDAENKIEALKIKKNRFEALIG